MKHARQFAVLIIFTYVIEKSASDVIDEFNVTIDLDLICFSSMCNEANKQIDFAFAL